MLNNLVKAAIISLGLFLAAVKGNTVMQLDQKNFNDTVDGTKFAFVFFYAPWHNHCQKILQMFHEVGEAFSGRDDVIIAKVNAYEQVKLATRFWIDDYPMFRFFIKGSKTEESYKGGHQLDDFVRFIQVKSVLVFNKDIFKTPVLDLDSYNFERIVKDHTKNLLIFYHNSYSDLCKTLQPIFNAVGRSFRNEPDCVMARVNCDSNKQICGDQLIAHFPTVKVYTTRNKDGFRLEPGKFTENFSEKNLTRFMNVLCGTQRTVRGGLDEKAGRLDEFDNLARQFMKEWHERDKILADALKKAESHEAKAYAEYYTAIMSRIIREGGEIIGEEIDRIDRLLTAPIHADKADQFEKRKNILKQFEVLHHERDEL